MLINGKRYLVLDVENTVQRDSEGRIDGSPFNIENYLVSVGACYAHENLLPKDVTYEFFAHNDLPPDFSGQQGFQLIQNLIDSADVLVGHNLKYDLHWLRQCNFNIEGKEYYCTMIGEYVLARGQKLSMSLAESAKRRNVHLKKSELVEEYFSTGTGYESMPLEIVDEYGRSDCVSCAELFLAQMEVYKEDDSKGLLPTVTMMNQMMYVLLDMETNGIRIDTDVLSAIEEEYLQEQKQLQEQMQAICKKVMGDNPINMNSPAQLSEIIYSRKVIDKNEWKEFFNIGLNAQGKPLFRPRLSERELRIAIDRMTQPVYKTCASICDDCDGKGSFFKTKKDGTPFKKATKCATCNGVGVKQTALPELAGFNLKVSNVLDTSANGFVTGKDIIGRLIGQARANGNEDAITFLESMQRLNAVSTYLTSFVKGIQRNTRPSGLLHTTFNQCRTATGRLSSSDPNFQNQPRGGTFPVRKCVVSRFDGGSIIEADFSGLEFRVAGELSKDAQIFEDIKIGKDVHKQTASIINMKSPDEVTKNERQQAKAYTFAPLYGGSGAGEPEHIRNYFNQYFDIYSGLSAWHTQLKNQVLKDGTVTLPSGRQLRWQNVERQSSGRVTYATQIVNYPVQSFATADIVPLACILAHKKFKDSMLKSKCVLTVHDSIVVDVYPGEEKEVVQILCSAMENVDREINYRYSYDMVMPLDIEIKSGSNWLEGKVIYE